jgi:hypothetical protein
MHFNATVASFPFHGPLSYRCLTSTVNHLPKTPRVSLSALQRLWNEEPFLSPDLSVERLSGFALLTQKFRSQGLATLSAASALRTLKASFSFQRSWVSPFRAFYSSPVIGFPFLKTLSVLALPCITSAALQWRLNGFLSPKKLYPLLATQRVNPGRGRLLSWAS